MAKTLDAQWLKTKQEYDETVRLYGPGSLRAKRLWAEMMELTTRILKRDMRRKAA